MLRQSRSRPLGWHLSIACLVIGAGLAWSCARTYAKRTRPQSLTINWQQTLGPARNLYSINLWAATDPKVGTSAQFGQQLGQLRPAICRIHAAEILKVGHAKAWIHPTGEWNSGKIAAILSNITPHCGEIMISIPSWSPTLHQGRQLPPQKYQAFAQWCAQLAQLITRRYPVKYFEILNEKDNAYNGNSLALAELTQTAAQEIKTVNPNIHIVGGAWTHPYDKKDIQSFLKAINKSDTIQAFSYHQYGTHQPGTDPKQLYRSAKKIGRRAKVVRQWMDRNHLSNAELFLGETHMFTTWKKDRKKLMRSHRGAVFLALIFQQATQHQHLDGIFPWNDADKTYGLLAPKKGTYRLRPSGYILKMLSQYFSQGQQIALQAPQGIDTLAVRNQTSHSLMLVNSDIKPAQVTQLALDGWQSVPQAIQIHTVDASGIKISHQTWPQITEATLNLPSESVTFLIFPNS